MNREKALKIIIREMGVIEEFIDLFLIDSGMAEVLDYDDRRIYNHLVRQTVRSTAARYIDEAIPSTRTLKAIARFYSNGVNDALQEGIKQLSNPALLEEIARHIKSHPNCPDGVAGVFDALEAEPVDSPPWKFEDESDLFPPLKTEPELLN